MQYIHACCMEFVCSVLRITWCICNVYFEFLCIVVCVCVYVCVCCVCDVQYVYTAFSAACYISFNQLNQGHTTNRIVRSYQLKHWIDPALKFSVR